MAEVLAGPVIPSDVIDAGNPAVDDDLWLPAASFIHNWRESFRLINQYTTDVKNSPSMVSSREGLRDRPRRLITGEIVAFEQDEMKILRALSFRQGQARSLAPLYCDQTFLTAPTDWTFLLGAAAGTGNWRYDSKIGNFDLGGGDQTIHFATPHDKVKGMLFLCASGTFPVITRTTPGEPDSDVDVVLPAATVVINQNQGAHSNNTGTNWHFHRGVVNFDVLADDPVDPTAFGIPSVDLDALTLDYLVGRGWATQSLASLRFMFFSTESSLLDLKVQQTVTLSCDTSLRRFYRGGRVMICTTPITSAAVPTFAIGKIGTVLTTGLALEDGFVNTFPVGSRVYPLIEGRPVLRPEITLETDTIGSLPYTVQEDVGMTQLPAAALPNEQTTADAAFGLPIFPFRGDWKTLPRLAIERSETSTPSGITDVAKLKGLRPVVVCEKDFEFIDRQSAWDFIRFWDSRRGRLFPFILELPTWELTGINYGVNDVEFHASGNERDWFFAQFVCFELADGSVEFLKVLSWERYAPPFDNLDHIVFTTDLPATVTAATVVRATFAISCCFDTDSMQEEWTSDETMHVTISFREYPFDQDVTIPVPDPRTGVERDPDGPFPGDPGMPPPGTVEYCQLQDCEGNPVNMWVRSNPAPPGVIYDPITGVVYLVDCTTTVTGAPPGTVVSGFEPVPYPPDDPRNPPWVPPCTASGGSCFDVDWMAANCPATKTVTIADPDGDATGDPAWTFSGVWTVTFDAGTWKGGPAPYPPSPPAPNSYVYRTIFLSCAVNDDGDTVWRVRLQIVSNGTFYQRSDFEIIQSINCPQNATYPFAQESFSGLSFSKAGATVTVSA